MAYISYRQSRSLQGLIGFLCSGTVVHLHVECELMGINRLRSAYEGQLL